ncbi:MAG: cbb3-type cytochrome oxidase cytochrome c subunit [Crocinitomicaceae bacterium]|jgi:cbb3-type cytochrome oxidase cytochrome c subunit
MKKSILAMMVIAAIGMVTFTSCSEEVKTENGTQEASSEEYYCPMKCEGEKTYAAEGTCPVCNMDLVKD